MIKNFLKENSALLCAFLIYFCLTIPFLSSSPLIWNDEGAYSEPAWNIVKYGYPIQQMWTGYVGYDSFSTHPNYLFFLSLAFMFKVFGAGIISGRMLSVVSGFLLMILIYFITKEIMGKRKGIIAVYILLFNPLFILFARMIRPEMLTTLLCFLGLFLVIKGLNNNNNLFFILSGFCGALAGLVHINGFFFLGAIFIFIVFKKNLKYIFYFLIGASLVIIPYVAFLLFFWKLFLLQFLGLFSYRVPFSIWSILENITTEPARWLIGKTVPISLWPGVIASIILIPKMKKVLIIYIPLICMLSYFILFDQSKYYGYLILVLPFFSILFGMFIVNLTKRSRKWIPILFLLFILLSGFSIITFKIVRDSQVSYDAYCYELKKNIADSEQVILGNPNLWFCFSNENLRSVSILIRIHEITEEPYSQIIKEQKIAYIILDPSMENFLKTGNKAFEVTDEYIEAITNQCPYVFDINAYTEPTEDNKKTKIYVCKRN
ncbi:MAG: glycosyltransferase family 39 protein [Candidatus Woesearchaeota archaeon]